MSYVLRFPVFIGSFTEEGTKTLRELTDKLPQDLNRFIAEYHSGLAEDTAESDKFELRLRVILTKSNHRTDAYSLEFVRWDDLSQEERAVVDELGKSGKVVVREQVRTILNHGYVRLSDVVTAVSAEIPFQFTQHHAVSAWRRQRVRPPTGDPHPERTNEKYCVYDALSNSYGYTEAWINRIVRKCRTAEGFENFTGCEAKRKENVVASGTATG